MIEMYGLRACVHLMGYNNKYTEKDVLGCIYELRQKEYISEEQAEELYIIADPEDRYNDYSEYANEMSCANPLLEMIENKRRAA